MSDFPNVACCIFLTMLDIIIKQISHWLKFTINTLGFGWGDALCKIPVNNQNKSGSRNRRVTYFFLHNVFYKTGKEPSGGAVKNSGLGNSVQFSHDKLSDL